MFEDGAPQVCGLLGGAGRGRPYHHCCIIIAIASIISIIKVLVVLLLLL